MWVLYYQTRESHSLYGNPLIRGRGCRPMNVPMNIKKHTMCRINQAKLIDRPGS
ncbi:hypothetical protein PGR6_06440 [Pseudomonas sp. GR 6-02]|nr:hypothetical protein PGR6_06440 [Pseudomonas sp. GR 6-02]